MRVCACAWCRRSVRTAIEQTWVHNPRWMGVFTSRYLCCLNSPWPLYREVFAEMVARGLLTQTEDEDAGFPRYLLSRLLPRPNANLKGETP
jgi:cell fate regulator YaaT (PSP1 superfamily)